MSKQYRKLKEASKETSSGMYPENLTVGKIYGIEKSNNFYDDAGFKRAAQAHKWYDDEYKGPEEPSGGSSHYYRVHIDNPTSYDQKPYTAECYDLIKALKLTWEEANIFKEIWRSGNERNDNGKPGNTPIRAAEKIYFFAEQNIKHIQGINND